MIQIYIVRGTTGDYFNRSEWLVAAYTDEVMAQEHVIFAQKRANEIRVAQDNADYFTELDKTNIYDPDGDIDNYTATRYFVVPVILYEKGIQK
jgi:hypothetical protein